MRFLQLLVIQIIVTTAFQEVIPDQSVIWTAHGQNFYFSHRLEDWTSAKINSREFDQNISPIHLSGSLTMYGIASDNPTKYLVISDKENQTLIILDIEAKWSTYFHMGTSKDIGQLTIDWLGHNVYWADTGYGWIAMKRLPADTAQHNSQDPNFRVVVDEFLERPTGLVVHPEIFYLFWTDTGETPKIERSDLIGGNRTVIVWLSLITPTALCIDQSSDRLFWTDPARGTIEYSDFDGNGRTILLSDPDINYYGISDSLIYTAPAYNRTGYVSLKENNEGKHTQASLDTDITFYHVLVYASELQEKPQHNAFFDTVKECEQMCLYMEQDAGFTCLCNDGYELRSGKTCSADAKILERHVLFTNDNNICGIAISVLGLPTSEFLQIHCDIVTEATVVTRFTVDMEEKIVFYTNGTVIYKQEAFKEIKTLLYQSSGTITDMDYDWKTRQLFWVEYGDGILYFIDVFDEEFRVPNTKKLSDSDVTNLAVDPHNRKVFWIARNSDGYTLNVWYTVTDETELIMTSLLLKPTDLEYDRLKDRLLWNDEEGHIGIISTDGTHERKYDSAKTSGKERHAITAYKNFILSTTAEDRQFDIIYELEPNVKVLMDLHKSYDGPVLDLHVYESTLQPSDLEPCEVNNGECEHICLPGNMWKCACFLGYILHTDKRSCKTDVLNDNFLVAMDTVHDRLYQIDLDTEIPYAIEIGLSNEPTTLAFDTARNEVIWVDADKRAVKKKKIGSPDETAVWSGVEEDAAITVDVSTGNIYISTGGDIVVISHLGDIITIILSTEIVGTVGKIAVMPESGLMSWFETGTTLRIVISNMDGSNMRPISVDMRVPEDITFDFKDETNLYWCDSELDKIEKIDTQSLSTTVIYEERGLRPVAIDIVGDILYFVPHKQRKIIQIDKNSGLGQTDVFESPLFGSLNNFFLARNVAGHDLCKNCNGGCSNLCLPIGKSKRCACADGIRLKDDESTCQFAEACPQDSYVSKPGLHSLVDCCPNVPSAVCKPQCKSGYEKRASVVNCKAGEWNISLNSVCEASESKPLPVIYIAAGAGGGAGGGAVLVIAIVVYVCMHRRNIAAPKDKGTDVSDHDTLAHVYEEANVVHSPDPPRSQPEPQVYDNINETEMVDASKTYVALPTPDETNKKIATGNDSTSSGRYSVFPATYGRRENGEPRPDFDTDNNIGTDIISGEGPDGYLLPISVSRGSPRDASGGSSSTMVIQGNRQHGDGLSAVTYIAGNIGSMSDGRVIIDSRTGRGSGNVSKDMRLSGHKRADGQVVMSGSDGHSGHI